MGTVTRSATGRATVWAIVIGSAPIDANAQVVLWERALPDLGYAIFKVAALEDGGCILAGLASSPGAVPAAPAAPAGRRVGLSRADREGRPLWTRAVGLGPGDLVGEVIAARNGNIVLVGSTFRDQDRDSSTFVVRASREGEILSEFLLGSPGPERAHSAIETADGDLVVTGTAGVPGETGDILIRRVRADGETRWRQTHGGFGSQHGRGIVATADGGFVVAGFTDEKGQNNGDVLLLKTDSAGDVLWRRTFGGESSDSASSIAVAKDGGLIICGWTATQGGGEGGGDLYLLRTDPLGAVVWEAAFGGTFWESGAQAIETRSGDVLAVGRSDSFGEPLESGSQALYLVRADANGRRVWDKVYGFGSSGLAVAEAADGGYLVAGSTLTAEGIPVGYLLKRVPGSVEESRFLRGDANRDHAVELSDAIAVLQGLFLGARFPAPACPDAADFDDDGDLNERDAIQIIEHLFLGGPPPAAPFPESGDDATLDALGCHL